MTSRRLLELNLAVGKKEAANRHTVVSAGIVRRAYINRDTVYVDGLHGTVPFNPCEFRSQGDDIIEREGIATTRERAGKDWAATTSDGTEGRGETRLIAAMRAYTGLSEPVELRNGDMWEIDNGRRLLTQFLGNGQWVLLCLPERSCQGGSVMLPWTFGLNDNQTIGTSAQFLPLLLDNGWVRVGTSAISIEIIE